MEKTDYDKSLCPSSPSLTLPSHTDRHHKQNKKDRRINNEQQNPALGLRDGANASRFLSLLLKQKLELLAVDNTLSPLSNESCCRLPRHASFYQGQSNHHGGSSKSSHTVDSNTRARRVICFGATKNTIMKLQPVVDEILWG
eukprot:m.72174 g.72174  ORF g.72174 m.72174 type:complete len:142 (-) comp20224_c0_seq1:784-1209(-)